MPPEITRLVNQFLRDPERIEVARPATSAQTITQRFRFAPDGEDWVKRELLRDLIRSENVKNAIIFCNRKRDVAILLKSLLKHGFNAGALHGDMDQKSRMETLDKFRSGEISLLAASDVAARGLDIPDVSHVFNFDLPWQSDDYVHRIGRTGRAGREGTSCSIVTPDELKAFKDIETMVGVPAVWIGEPPTEQDFADAGKRRRGRGGRGGAARPGREGSRDGGRREGRNRRPERRPSAGSERAEARGRPSGDRHEHGPSAPQASESRSQDGAREAAREPRQAEGRRDGARAVQAREPREPRSAEPRSGRGGDAARPREPRHEDRPAQQPQRARPRGGDAEPAGGGVGAFAGNVPAFLRRPPRPVKAAGE
jgi:superfamily II DNA/RNA helicase